MRIAAVIVIVLAATAPAMAQTPDAENGRYTFKDVDQGVLRLDSRTGQVSVCAKRAAGWACEAVPDERPVATLPPGMQQREFNVRVPLPSDAEIDRAMAALEKVWKRLIEMVQRNPPSDKI